jgi:hypothetical protein
MPLRVEMRITPLLVFTNSSEPSNTGHTLLPPNFAIETTLQSQLQYRAQSPLLPAYPALMTLPLCLASFAASNSLNHHLPLFRDMASISLTDILPFILILHLPITATLAFNTTPLVLDHRP